MLTDGRGRLMAVLMVLGALCGPSASAEEVKVWDLPESAKPEDQSGWKPAETGAAFKSGAALQNGRVVVMVAVGGPGAVIQSTKAGITASARVGVVPTKGTAGKIDRIELVKKERGEAVLRLGLGACQVDVKLKSGQPFIEVAPIKEADAVEVRSKTAYALLPDLFGYDTVYDARRFKSPSLMVPAENFLLSLEEGGDAMVMCVWQGTLSLGKKEEAAAKDAKDPRVDIFFAGEGPARRVERTRIEFAGKSVFVAVLASKGTWLDLDVGDWKAQEPRELAWKRPFEAKWRATLVCKEGAWSKDFQSGTLSARAWVRGEEFTGDGIENGRPRTGMQGLYPHFTYPFWIDKDKTFISLYAEMGERKSGKVTNMFQRAIAYPFDRRKDTPLGELTLVDVVRETLGEGPCEYALDQQGIQKQPSGGKGKRELLAGASCPIYDDHISHFVKAAKGQDAPYKMNGQQLKGLKPGEKFPPEMEARLVQALEDIGLFLRAVNARIAEYHEFSGKLATLCESEGRRSPAVKPLADAVLAKVRPLQARTDREKPGFDKKCADWTARLDKIVAEVKAGNYANIHVPSPGNLANDLADPQDYLVSFQRRVVKSIRAEASSVDSTDAEVIKFATQVRTLCHDALRSRHELEQSID